MVNTVKSPVERYQQAHVHLDTNVQLEQTLKLLGLVILYAMSDMFATKALKMMAKSAQKAFTVLEME